MREREREIHYVHWASKAYAGAHFVRPLLSVMSAIVCLIALIFRAFGSSMQRFSGILMTP